MTLSIVILCFNRIDLVKRTISCIIDKTSIDAQYIFVDNGSSDGTREYLLSVAKKIKAKCVFNRKNRGVAGGRNSGLLHADGDLVLFLDSDILVPDDYDNDLISAFKNVDKIGLIGINVEKKKYKAVCENGVNLQVKGGNLNGAALCLNRSALRKIGFFNPEYGVYGGEDIDLHERIDVAGFRQFYLEKNGTHLGNSDNMEYKNIKKSSHTGRSPVYREYLKNVKKYKSGDIYIGYKICDHDSSKFDRFFSSGDYNGNPCTAYFEEKRNDRSYESFLNNNITNKVVFSDHRNGKNCFKFLKLNDAIEFLTKEYIPMCDPEIALIAPVFSGQILSSMYKNSVYSFFRTNTAIYEEALFDSNGIIFPENLSDYNERKIVAINLEYFPQYGLNPPSQLIYEKKKILKVEM